MRYVVQVFATAFRIRKIVNTGDGCIIYPDSDSNIDCIFVSDTWVMNNKARVGGYYVLYDSGDSEFIEEDEFKMRATFVDED